MQLSISKKTACLQYETAWPPRAIGKPPSSWWNQNKAILFLVQHNNLKRQIRKARIQFSDDTSKMGASLWLFITHLVLIMGFLGELSLWDSLQGIPTHPQVTRVSFCMNSRFPGFSPADVWKYNFTHHQQKVCVWKTFVRNLLKIPAHTGGPVCSN